ncbi:MAG: hypothetical protein HZB70_00990 [Candidatus Berkelbacteria bacterium]|nr:MAG: hypothetical protein HZB70_00990 [Candidatus Berkelbacteria bacterium]QQG52085.1 MAG: hypothetical protein HY845_02005 [Candidatus Berkelbacteria bacterium]
MARHLRINQIRQDGEGVNTDVDGFDKEKLDKLRHHTRSGAPSPFHQLGAEARAALKKHTKPKTLWINFCCTCGERASDEVKLVRQYKTLDVVRCENCMPRHIDTFPARYCIYCGHNIEPHEPRQAICPTCLVVPAARRSTRLPK